MRPYNLKGSDPYLRGTTLHHLHVEVCRGVGEKLWSGFTLFDGERQRKKRKENRRERERERERERREEEPLNGGALHHPSPLNPQPKSLYRKPLTLHPAP